MISAIGCIGRSRLVRRRGRLHRSALVRSGWAADLPFDWWCVL